jgi:hypothetical protein
LCCQPLENLGISQNHGTSVPSGRRDLLSPRHGRVGIGGRGSIRGAARWRGIGRGCAAWSCIGGGGRGRIGCPRNIGRSGRQVRCSAGRTRIIAGRGTSAARRLAIIGRWRRVIFMPASAGEKSTGHRYGNCQKFHAPLLCVGGGQESNKSAATGQEEGSG